MPEQRFDLDFPQGSMDYVVKFGGPASVPGTPPQYLPVGTEVAVTGLPKIVLNEGGRYVGWFWTGHRVPYEEYVPGPDPGSYSFTLPEPVDDCNLDVRACETPPPSSGPWHTVLGVHIPWSVERTCDAALGPPSAVDDDEGPDCGGDDVGAVRCSLGG